MTKEQLKTRLPGDIIYCCNRNSLKMTEFDVVATVIENNPANEQITLDRAIKYGKLRIKGDHNNNLITLDYDSVLKYYEIINPAFRSLQKYVAENELTDEQKLYWDSINEICIDDRWFYEDVALWCLQNKIKDVTDIGCYLGMQSELFVPNGIKYTGVEEYPDTTILAPCTVSENCNLIHGTYPCKLPHGTMAISNLCVGYLCTGENVYKTLAEQFEYLVLDRDEEKDLIEEYWTEIYRGHHNSYTRSYRLKYPNETQNVVTNMIVYQRKRE